MSGHTSGPWEVEENLYYTGELFGARDAEGYRTSIATLYNTYHRTADWRLIQNAPELLSELKVTAERLAIAEYDARMEHREGRARQLRYYIDRASRTIAKAEGRE